MPIYEFYCPECGKEIEVLTRSFNEEIDTACSCGAEMKRKWATFTPIYKGAGFYTTESRGITGRKRKPNIKVGTISDLSPAEQERMK